MEKSAPLQKPDPVKCLAVRSPGPPFAELSITGMDHRLYLLTKSQLKLIVRSGMEVLSRLERDD